MIRTGDLLLSDSDALRIDLLGPLAVRIRGWLAGRMWLRRQPRYAALHRAVPGQSTMVSRSREIAELAAAFPEMAPIPDLVQGAPLAPPMHPSPYLDESARHGRTVFPPLIRPARYFDDEVTVPDPESLPRRLAPDWRSWSQEIPVASIGQPSELAGAR